MIRRNFIQTFSFLPFFAQHSMCSFFRLYPKPFQDKKNNSVYPTGIKELDKTMEGGFRKGEIYLFMGKNGCGKTTLANRIYQSTNYCQMFSGQPLEEIKNEVNRPVLLIDDFDEAICSFPFYASYRENHRENIRHLYNIAQKNNLSVVVFQSMNRSSSGFPGEVKPYILACLSFLIIVIEKLNHKGHGKLIVQKNYFASRKEIEI